MIHKDLLIELGRRERQQNIRPDPDIDAFMKVITRDLLSREV